VTLRFISAGAAHGLVSAYGGAEGQSIEGSFGAVGAMMERFRAGEDADIVILTHAQIAQLTAEAGVVPGTAADLGAVPTSIAVRASDPAPAVGDADGLRSALLAADAIYFPDPSKATAGIHFAKVIDQLGIRDDVAARIRTFPNGSTAMRAMSEAGGKPIGCTQATEILATAGVRLVAPLPRGLDLDTVYTAAVHAKGGSAHDAEAFVQQVTGEATRGLRRRAGFGGHAIRPATSDDYDPVRAVVSSVLSEFAITPDPADADLDLVDIETTYFTGGTLDVVTDAEGHVVGSCGIVPLDAGRCELKKMYLLPNARGHRVGRRLLDRAIAFARGRGFRAIELTTASVLAEAIAMYRRHGFTPIQRDMPRRCDQAFALAL
jgi:molybdate transport system substrate-binding protein